MDAVTFQAEAMRCERLMYHVGYSILHNDQDCADAVQEALTRAWQKQHTLRIQSGRILRRRNCRYAGRAAGHGQDAPDESARPPERPAPRGLGGG